MNNRDCKINEITGTQNLIRIQKLELSIVSPLVKNWPRTQEHGMIPPPVYRPERPIPPVAEKQVVG